LHCTPRSLRTILPILLASTALLVLLGGIASAAPTDLPPAIVFDQTIAAIISQVSTRTLEYELAGLTGERPVVVAGSLYTIATRYSYQTEAISLATRYAYEQLDEAGLAVTYHDYAWGSYRLRNVVAEKPGVVDPGEIYLITAHLDSTTRGNPYDLAPGADDNGSGSVAVLTAARLLAPHHFAHTVRFVLFTGEEQGLLGSAAYAAVSKARGEDIQGVVNLDMIAYNSNLEPVIDLYARTAVSGSLALTRIFSEVVGIYGLNLEPNRYDLPAGFPIQSSDQWSFLQWGYPALLVIEDMDDSTPAYHRITDTLSTLDLGYYADTTRAAIATIAHLGQLLPQGYLSGTIYALDTGWPLSTTVAAIAPTVHYTFTALTDPSGGYVLPLPVGVYTLTAWPASPGHYPAMITNVSIITDVVTVQDIGLLTWPRVYLPLVAHAG